MTAGPLAPAPPATRPGARAGHALRTDIQGLRALAVGLVVLYHAGLPWVPGGYVGVDVFFVISGFLITGLILREVESTGRLDLARFYARRARRLLPATAVVFVGVAVLTVAALPVTRWAGVAGDMVASALYVVNWRLAERSVDYLAEGAAASPLQHFWSLAVEEQFYVLWPLLIVALLWWAARGARSQVTRRRLLLGLVALAAPSLAFSVHLTATDPGRAYFVTTTRVWELAVGAVLAVLAGRAADLPRAVRTGLGWAGLAAVLVAATTYDATTPFPGVAALLPVLGTAAILAAGAGDGRGRLRPLDAPPLQDVGALSYSLYLWHWPLLVVATAVWGSDGSLWLPTALLVVGFSAVPAWFTYRAVERPLHETPSLAEPRRALVLAVVCVLVGVLAALGIRAALPPAAEGPASGAVALGPDPAGSPAGEVVDAVDSITPSAADAVDDNADVYADGCHQNQQQAEPLRCTYGDPDGDVRVALVGDSHAAHWQPTLRVLAEEHGWRLDTYSKSACLFGDVPVWSSNDARDYVSCGQWHDNVLAELVEEPYDVVVTSMSGGHSAVVEGARLKRPEADPVLAEGVARTWRAVGGTGATVVGLVDTPWVGIDVPECVAENPAALSECAASRETAVATSAAAVQQLAADLVPAAELVDLTDWVCPGDRCPAVIGGVMVFRDRHHLTATYARSLADALGPRLEDAILARERSAAQG